MEDRLAELRDKGGPETLETETDELMPDFNKKVNLIHFHLKKIKQNTEQITALKERHNSATLAEAEKAISETLDRLISDNTKACKQVKEDLEAIESEVVRSKREEKGEPETRIKEITYKALKSKFAEVLKESQVAQIDFKTAAKSKLSRHIKIVDPSLTADQVEEVCNDPEGADKLLSGKMLGRGHIRLQNAVSDIKEKFQDIKKLERSIETIHQMFTDIQMLVQAQGEMLDNIQLNVEEAENYVKKANKELKKAKESHKKWKKWKCILLLCLVIVIAIVIVVPIVAKS
jgi:syntaxin 1B/2/3